MSEKRTDLNRPEPTESDKQQWREAERAFDLLTNGAEMHSRAVETYTTLGMRTLGLVAAGGIAATLGFYSANYSRLMEVRSNLDTVNQILGLLFISLIITLLCILLAYFSQLTYTASLEKMDRSYQHPYVSATPGSNHAHLIGDICRWAAVATALASAGCLVAAGWQFLGLVH